MMVMDVIGKVRWREKRGKKWDSCVGLFVRKYVA